MTMPIEQCISCGGRLEIRELYCENCDITIRGRFPLEGRGPFARLSDDQLAFLHLFVTSRGNMSDIERSLGVSYPTVRAKLDDLIAALEPASEVVEQPAGSDLSRAEIMDRVQRGELSVDEAMAMLEALPADSD
ncbi:MAG TPA: DUF2089 domain-containing protein [Thermomicrobiales bacterium]|nr:DUF2089 domain-containing protein [Thermomicrobiales bacterium]